MSQCYNPYTSPTLQGQSKSNCPAPYSGYSTAIPVGGAVDTNDWCIILFKSILLKEPFALKNSETVYFTSIFSTSSYSDIAPIDNFDLNFFYFYFVFEVFDTIQF